MGSNLSRCTSWLQSDAQDDEIAAFSPACFLGCSQCGRRDAILRALLKCVTVDGVTFSSTKWTQDDITPLKVLELNQDEQKWYNILQKAQLISINRLVCIFY